MIVIMHMCAGNAHVQLILEKKGCWINNRQMKMNKYKMDNYNYVLLQ